MQVAFECRNAFATATLKVNIISGNRTKYFSADTGARNEYI